jgi:hypothetical protein
VSRQWRFLWILTATLFLGIAALWFAMRRDTINRQSYEGIKHGMTQRDVEAILGVPPDDPPVGGGFRSVWAAIGATEFKSWSADCGSIRVWFDNRGCVVDTRFVVPQASSLSVWNRIRLRLGLLELECDPTCMP